MTRTKPVFASLLPIADAGPPPGQPAYLWLTDLVRSAILTGAMAPGTRLPATRDLAAELKLSRGTVVAAFAQLRAEGYTHSRTGSGTCVSATIPETLLRAPNAGGSGRVVPPRRHRSALVRRIDGVPLPDAPSSRAFRANQPAIDLFPTTLWAQVAARRLRRATTFDLLSCDALGHIPLRKAVADYLRTSRGVRCTYEQVAVVAGVQEAVYIAARMFIDPGDRVCVESPGYVAARRVFDALGARVIPVPVDAEGMTVPKTRAAAVRMAYVTPAHQYPLGITMSLARRTALLQWASDRNAVIIEDDYDSEYRYAGRPMPALQGLDANGNVLFAGSFSKVLFPSLRLGYLVVPTDLVERVAAIKSLSSRHAPVLEQAVLCDFIIEGHFARHIRRMRQIYAGRLEVLTAEAGRHLAGLLDVPPVDGGMQTVGWLNAGVDAHRVVEEASRRNVEVTAIRLPVPHGGHHHGLQLGFAAVDEQEITRGVRELARLLR